MKRLFEIVFIIVGVFILAPSCFASQDKVLVLPDDLKFSATNYYIYPDTSVMFATEVTDALNKSGKVETVSMVEIRKTLRDDLKFTLLAKRTLKEFKYNYNINYVDLKKIGKKFGVSKILLITSSTDIQNYFMRRTFWNWLNIPGTSVVDPAYKVSSFAALVDVENELILWQQSYSKILAALEMRIVPVGFAPSTAQVDRLKMYSKVLTPTIAKQVEKHIIPQVQESVDGKILPISHKFKKNKDNESVVIEEDIELVQPVKELEIKSKPYTPIKPRTEIAPPLINDL